MYFDLKKMLNEWNELLYIIKTKTFSETINAFY